MAQLPKKPSKAAKPARQLETPEALAGQLLALINLHGDRVAGVKLLEAKKRKTRVDMHQLLEAQDLLGAANQAIFRWVQKNFVERLNGK